MTEANVVFALDSPATSPYRPAPTTFLFFLTKQSNRDGASAGRCSCPGAPGTSERSVAPRFRAERGRFAVQEHERHEADGNMAGSMGRRNAPSTVLEAG